MITKEDIVYIAGPMTGYPDHNYPAFFAMQKLLERMFECKVINPAANFGGDTTLPRKQYMRVDFGHVLECTAVVFLDRWVLSSGAFAEHVMATQLELPMYKCEYGEIKPL